MLKKTRFYAAITLFIQSFTFVVLFLMLCFKKQSIGKALLAVAMAGGLAGVCLLCLDTWDDPEERRRPIVVRVMPKSSKNVSDAEEDDSFFEENVTDEVDITEAE